VQRRMFETIVGATNEVFKLRAQRTNVRNQRALRDELKLRSDGESLELCERSERRGVKLVVSRLKFFAVL
jgi:hypothetical protein